MEMQKHICSGIITGWIHIHSQNVSKSKHVGQGTDKFQEISEEMAEVTVGKDQVQG